MNALAAPLYGASVAALLAVILGLAQGRLTPLIAGVSLAAGALAAALGFWHASRVEGIGTRERRSPSIAEWLAIALFTLFAARVFGWVVFRVADEIRVLSPNNLGDLSLHITYIRLLASGASFWPGNPIYAGAPLTYPLGVDLLNSLVVLSGGDLFRSFIWAGLLGSILTGLALWRWGRGFALAAFLCNGGLAGFAIFWTGEFVDFQSALAWKSIPLALFATQRGLLFAVPAGLLLLLSWRARWWDDNAAPTRPLPLWGELLLYAAMPLFHLHTFLFLSGVLAVWFSMDPVRGLPILRLVALAFIPASALVWLVTGGGHAGSMIGWDIGWMQDDADWRTLCEEHWGLTSPLATVPLFWIYNFGAVPLLLGAAAAGLWRGGERRWPLAMLVPGLVMFAMSCLVRLAPWEWDNTKIMLWCYLAVLPALWTGLLERWPAWARALACVALFGSGFASLLGGLRAPEKGFGIARHSELLRTAHDLAAIPADQVFIAHPTFNHPLLLVGRPLAMGYSGHVWSHGYEWRERSALTTEVLTGAPGWREKARALGARYLYWGTIEEAEYPASTRPWEKEARRVGPCGEGWLFDLGV